ncbi:hypothetical protein COLO4_22597 [Corchorus olitorius]|uniref:Uncharacterized protein n=1 Tax=Corchorus olitorius TaxID=93759 RepID=A0A1R3IL84_9ROSI|nr:hypothetical protein COLO4_22597 [Corchorus olitorius]
MGRVSRQAVRGSNLLRWPRDEPEGQGLFFFFCNNNNSFDHILAKGMSVEIHCLVLLLVTLCFPCIFAETAILIAMILAVYMRVLCF